MYFDEAAAALSSSPELPARTIQKMLEVFVELCYNRLLYQKGIDGAGKITSNTGQ